MDLVWTIIYTTGLILAFLFIFFAGILGIASMGSGGGYSMPESTMKRLDELMQLAEYDHDIFYEAILRNKPEEIEDFIKQKVAEKNKNE
jgi:hypothetical protein